MARKNPQADIRLFYRKALELSLCSSLLLTILIFFAFRQEFSFQIELETPELDIEVEEIPPTEQIVRPPAPPRPSVPIPTDTEEIPEDETIDATEINFAEIPPPPPPQKEDFDESSFSFVAYDEPPELIGGVNALQRLLVYPELALKAGIEGSVTIGVLIDKAGRPVNFQVLKAFGVEVGFEAAAIEAMKKGKWKPAFQRDLPVKAWVAIPVHFKLMGGTDD